MLRRLNSRCRGFLEISEESTRSGRSDHTNRTSHSHDSQDPETSEDDDADSTYASDFSEATNKPLPPIPFSTGGLQEVETDVLVNLKVQYLHRSARDFLEKPEIWDKITTTTTGHFDPHLSLCGMHVLQLKTLEFDEALISKLWKTIIPCLAHLGDVQTATEELETSLMRELESAMRYHGNIADFKIYIPAIAVKFGIFKYVQVNLIRGTFPFVDQVGQPLLDIAILQQSKISGLEELADAVQTTSKQPPLPNIGIAKLLLEHGADPNQKYNGSTPWINLFRQAAIPRPYSPAYGLELKERWLDGIELFLQHGADPEARDDIASGQALRIAFRYSNAQRVAELQALLNEQLRLRHEAQPQKLRTGWLACVLLRCFA